MRIKVENDGGYTEYTCRHIQETTVRPGSPAAEREGPKGERNAVGIHVEVVGVTCITRAIPTADGHRIESETCAAEDRSFHIPSDGHAAYVMDQYGATTKVLRWKEAS